MQWHASQTLRFIASVGSLLALGHATPASAAYTYTLIAGIGNGFTAVEVGGMNGAGRVSFLGWPGPTQGYGVYTGDGTGLVKTIEHTSGPFSGFSIPDVGANGTACYRASGGPSGWGIFLDDGPNPVVTIASSAAAGGSFQLLFEPDLNAAGKAVFLGSKPGGYAIVTGNGGALTTVAATTGLGGTFGLLGSNPGIGPGGLVGFMAYSAGVWEVRTWRPSGAATTATTLVATSAGASPIKSVSPRVRVNRFGAAVFQAALNGGGEAIYVGDGTLLVKRVDTSGPFTSMDYRYSINACGAIAFEADLGVGQHGVFTGKDPVADKVLAVGDTLFGETVLDIEFGDINDKGQIALLVQLTPFPNFTAIVRADPVAPPPCFCPYDFNQDGFIDQDDLALLLDGSTGIVQSAAALSMLLSLWGPCP